MPTYTTGAASINPATRYLDEQRKMKLAASAEELAGIRFSIMLTAKWEASDSQTPERRGELRAELSILRSLYLNQIDDIAMAFGVQEAMDLKDEVERTVTVPKEMSLSEMPIETDELYF